MQSPTHFTALQDLELLDLNKKLVGKAFVGMPTLERLRLEGEGVSGNFKIRLQWLRSLTLSGYDECVALDLDCPLLMKSIKFGGNWHERFACPVLKKVHFAYDFRRFERNIYGDGYEAGDYNYNCDTVEDLMLQSPLRENIVIGCIKLERLVISWFPLTKALGRLPT